MPSDPEAELNELFERAIGLCDAVDAYRYSYEFRGADHIETGREWDRMRRAKDALRGALNNVQ